MGNLSYFTTEAQIYDFFNRAGEVKRVVMGLDKFQKTPCGFCFVEYAPAPFLSQRPCFVSCISVSKVAVAWSGSQPGPSVATKLKIFFVTAICVAFVHSACDSLKCHEPLVIPFNTNHIVPRRRAVVRSGFSISCSFARADTTQPRTQRQVSGISMA